MARLYFRSMVEQNGKPKRGRSARLLGIRPGVDIDVVIMPQGWLDKQGQLRPESNRSSTGATIEVVLRNTKGMSSSLSIQGLPPFRKPAKWGGTSADVLWQIEDTYITGDLEAVQDSDTHVSIMPRITMGLERYEAAIAATQEYWETVD
jgi:hypothetical protein